MLLTHPLFEASRQDVTFPLHVAGGTHLQPGLPRFAVHYQLAPVQTAKSSVDDSVPGVLRVMDSEAGFTGRVNLGNPSDGRQT